MHVYIRVYKYLFGKMHIYDTIYIIGVDSELKMENKIGDGARGIPNIYLIPAFHLIFTYTFLHAVVLL